MMKLAIIFLPISFKVIWAAFIGLGINRVETRDGKRKLVNLLVISDLVYSFPTLNNWVGNNSLAIAH